MDEETRAQITALITEALLHVDRIAKAERMYLDDDYANRTKKWLEHRNYTLKDARTDARCAAALLRQAWDAVDPTLFAIQCRKDK